MLSEYFVMALNNLSRRRLRSWLTLLGIFIGIATIVTLISLGDGLQDAVLSQFDVLGPDVIFVSASVGFGQTTEPFGMRDVRIINRISGVDIVAPTMFTSSIVTFQGHARPVSVRSVPEGDMRNDYFRIFPMDMMRGRQFTLSDRTGAIVGYNVAHSNNYRRDMRVGDRFVLGDTDIVVIGVAERKGNFEDDSTVWVPENLYNDLFSVEGVDIYDGIGVRARNADIVAEVAEDIENDLLRARGLDPIEQNFQVQTAEDIADQVGASLFGVQLFFYIIASISIVVGGIGIANTMYTSVLERTREIGIMKAIGARNSTIFTLFFMESGLLGMVGGVVGVLLGIGAGIIADSLSGLLTPQFSPELILGSMLFAFLMGSASGIVPAYRASKLHPVDALTQTK